MPPKAKFTREEIINAAFDLTRAQGLEALTARALGEKLGSSARPIFSVFNSMEEVHSEVLNAARRLYTDFINRGLRQTPPFRGVGIEYIRFAIDEPKLFMLLFMSEQEEKPSINSILPVIDENYPQILKSIKNSFGLEDEQAKRLYRHLWIYSHGIAVLCATKLCSFTADEIEDMLTEVCVALIRKIKGDKND